MRTDTGQVIRLEDYEPSAFLVPEVALDFRLDPVATQVHASLTVERRDGTDPLAPLVLDGEDLELVSVSVDGEVLGENRYEASAGKLAISGLPAQGRFTVETLVRIDPTANTQLMGLYRTSGNFCTQCEAEGFRRITWHLDRPDVLSVYTVRMEADLREAPVLLSNGNRLDSGTLEGGRHFAVWHDPFPKPSYLFALFAGNLGCVRDRFTTMSGREVKLEIHVEHGKEPRAAYAMDALKRSMRWDEERFGREYDLDVFMIVAVSDFNMGAMENKGLNIFNDKYVLADPRTATDQDYANIEAIIAHEYFHNWTGNRITCRDWFQLCLKEGLTVYRDHEFSADMRSRPVRRIAEVRLLRAHQFPEDNGPLAHPVRPRKYREINNFYTATVYEKGSEVVRMLATILGEDGFRAGMDLYFDRHDGQAATIEQFLACFADATGEDLTRFALWYEQPGTPNLSVISQWSEATGTLSLVIEQSLRAPVAGHGTEPRHIPLAFGLVGADGSDLEWTSVTGARVANGVIHVTSRQQTVHFTGLSERPVVSLLRGFSAPVTLQPRQPAADRQFLARHDRDTFSRWEALNSLLVDHLKAVTTCVRRGEPVDHDEALTAIFAAVAGDGTLDNAYRALCLTLPGEADIAREIGSDIDPDAIHRAHGAVTTYLARSCETVFARIYHELQPRRAYAPDAAGAGRRALRHIATEMLCRASGRVDMAISALAAADNMTDRAHALMLLAHLDPDNPATAEALDAFRADFRNEPIVLDKWYTIQATVPREDTMERVERLAAQPGFSFENPNRVRALIGAFATGNMVGFHRADGRGYGFLCQAVARIDAVNPQVAARLMTALRAYRTLEPGRRQLAEGHIRHLASREHLSVDLRDILERTLAR